MKSFNHECCRYRHQREAQARSRNKVTNRRLPIAKLLQIEIEEKRVNGETDPLNSISCEEEFDVTWKLLGKIEIATNHKGYFKLPKGWFLSGKLFFSSSIRSSFVLSNSLDKT